METFQGETWLFHPHFMLWEIDDLEMDLVIAWFGSRAWEFGSVFVRVMMFEI